MNRHLLPAAAALLTAGVLLFPLQVATAQSAPPPAAPSAEAWYRTTAAPVAPVCALPVGCPAAPLPSQYPPGTLHIGVTAGQEEARTYLAFDLSGVTGEVTGGALTLPVAPDPEAGSRAPETARMRACLATGPVQDGVEGEFQPAPPAIDCAMSADAVFQAGDGMTPAVFTVELAAFAEALGSGAALALVPADGVPPTDNWHVALSRRDRQVEGAVPISATFQVAAVESPPAGEFDAGSFEVTSPSESFTSAPPFESPSFVGDTGVSFAAPSLSAPVEQPLDAPVAPEVAAPQVTSVPVASVLAGPFAYPAVFLLPLLFAVGVGWAGRAFTRDLVPV